MRTRAVSTGVKTSIGAWGVGLALALAGCPSGVDEQGGVDDSAGEGGAEQGPDDIQRPISHCPYEDPWEPNGTAEQPSVVAWQSADGWTAHREISDAGLCAGEDDWYRYDVENLGYVEHYLYVRALVENAGLCGMDCGQPELVPGPQYEMTVEVYRAYDMQLLTSSTDDDGVLAINGPGGEAYTHDLLIRVFSETLAQYSYRLSVEIRNYDGEDECEC